MLQTDAYIPISIEKNGLPPPGEYMVISNGTIVSRQLAGGMWYRVPENPVFDDRMDMKVTHWFEKREGAIVCAYQELKGLYESFPGVLDHGELVEWKFEQYVKHKKLNIFPPPHGGIS